MHNLEPYYNWLDKYDSSKDERSPFFGAKYNEFQYTTKIYNYFIHPQWDDLGSQTLFIKILFANYDQGYCVLEMLGEWNDCLYNDIMTLKNNVLDHLMRLGINKFVLIGENVLNFHASDECYYEEWWNEVIDMQGWIMALNFPDHVIDEAEHNGLTDFIHFNRSDRTLSWRTMEPLILCQSLDSTISKVLNV